MQFGGFYHDNPFDKMLSGYESGLRMRRFADENKLLLAEQDHKAQAMRELQGLDFNDQNAVRQFAARYPEYGKGAKEYIDALDEKRTQALRSDMSKIISLLQNKRSDLAVQDLQNKALAFRNSGDEKTALEYEDMANWISTDSNSAFNGLMMSYALITDKDNATNYETMIKTNRPTTEFKNAGDRYVPVTTDGITGDVVVGDADAIDIGVSPDVQLQQDTAIATTNMNNETQKYVSDNTRAASEYGANLDYQGRVYASNMGYAGQVYSSDQANYRAEMEAESRERIEQAELYYKAQQDEIKNNQAEFKEFGGQVYLVYKNGSAKLAVDETGRPLSAGSVKLNESQAKNNLFVSRMADAHSGLSAFENRGIYAPIVSHMGEWGEKYATSAPPWLGGANDEQGQYMQHQRNFINAVLRMESGAVIGKEEFESASKQYFPRIGDSQAVIRQKQRNRQVAIDAIRQGLPAGYGNVGVDTQQKPLSHYFTGK